MSNTPSPRDLRHAALIAKREAATNEPDDDADDGLSEIERAPGDDDASDDDNDDGLSEIEQAPDDDA